MGRWLKIATSSPRAWGIIVGIILGIIALERHEQPQEKTSPQSDYSLTLVDARGRPLSNRVGSLKLVFDPFTIYRHAPSQSTASYTIDESGFRGGRGKGPPIFVLGGSAAFGQDLPNDRSTLSACLNRLDQDGNYVNAGVVGFLAGQELALMVHYLDEEKPKGYVVFDGWNELFDQWQFGPRVDRRFGFNNSFFEVEDRLALAVDRWASRAGSSTRTPEPIDPIKYVQALLDHYHHNLEKMHDFARARGAFLLVASQPELGMKRYQTQSEQVSWDGWNRAYRYADSNFSLHYRTLVHVTGDFCRKRGIHWISVGEDPLFLNSTETLFLDPVHLEARGCEQAAFVLHSRLNAIRREDIALIAN